MSGDQRGLQEELAAIVAIGYLTLDKTNNNQALQAAATTDGLRFKLTQDEYLYISPTGNDSSDVVDRGGNRARDRSGGME